jgi:hypothetical protein
MSSHESYIAAIADIAALRLSANDAAKVKAIKLAYGAGPSGVRGVTYYGRWNAAGSAVPFVEISAFNQESVCQIAGTVLHELGHVLAPIGAGHNSLWKDACTALGLRRVKAAGTLYTWANFTPDMRERITALPLPRDGAPAALVLPNGLMPKLRRCGAGIGTQGGKARGPGSGSRLRLWECECIPAVKVRVARDNFDAQCNCCGAPFHKPLYAPELEKKITPVKLWPAGGNTDGD